MTTGRRELIPVSPDHEQQFRKTFRLRDDLASDPCWQAAYEHAAKYRLYPDEMEAIGGALVRNAAID